jgi:hypothetical protein
MTPRRHRRRSTPLKYYVIIAAACAAVAVLAQFLFDAPDQVRRLAEEKLDSAVREAVQDEVRRATENP